MRRLGLLLAVALVGSQCLFASGLRLPQHIQAGQDLSLETSGSGDAKLYLFGPDRARKLTVKLGGPVKIEGSDLTSAGRYILVLDGESSTFFVTAGPVESVAFIARPSRVPAATRDVVNGTAFLFDRYQNIVLTPQQVSFELTVAGAPDVKRVETSHDGIAWARLDSSHKQGAAQFLAASGPTSVRRVVQEVAADPCSIRIHAEKDKDGRILVRTDPIRDCAGNEVPDGTIVTFTSVDAGGRSTVDARIKRGFAQAELPASPHATISVAAGVVLGNEIRWGGGNDAESH